MLGSCLESQQLGWISSLRFQKKSSSRALECSVGSMPARSSSGCMGSVARDAVPSSGLPHQGTLSLLLFSGV